MSLIIREMQIKTLMQYYFTLISMAIMKINKTSKNQKIPSVGQDVDKLVHLCIVGGNVKW